MQWFKSAESYKNIDTTKMCKLQQVECTINTEYMDGSCGKYGYNKNCVISWVATVANII